MHRLVLAWIDLQILSQRLRNHSAFAVGSIHCGVDDIHSKPFKVFTEHQVGYIGAAVEQDRAEEHFDQQRIINDTADNVPGR